MAAVLAGPLGVRVHGVDPAAGQCALSRVCIGALLVALLRAPCAGSRRSYGAVCVFLRVPDVQERVQR